MPSAERAAVKYADDQIWKVRDALDWCRRWDPDGIEHLIHQYIEEAFAFGFEAGEESLIEEGYVLAETTD